MGALSLGLNMNNFFGGGYSWTNGSSDEADASMRLGAKYDLGKDMTFLFDMVNRTDGGSGMGVGAEWRFKEDLHFRAGMESGKSSNMMFGFATFVDKLRVDFTYMMDGTLGGAASFISFTLQVPKPIDDMEKLNNKFDRMMSVYVEAADKDYSEGKYADAVEKASFVKKIAPDNISAKDLLGRIEKAISNDVSSEAPGQSKKQLTKKQQDTIRESLAKALNYFYLSEYQLAAEECQKVLEINPDEVTALKRLGSIYYVKGDKQRALLAWQKANTLDPSNKELQKFIDYIRR